MGSPISPEVVHHLQTVADPALSPDAARLAYTLSRVDQERTETRSRIIMMELESGRSNEFTQGASDSTPRFAPDGRTLAFLRPDSSRRRQVWLIGIAGGEARRLTNAPGGVFDFAWSPDSDKIVFSADVDPDAPPDSKSPPAEPRVRVVRRIRYRHDTRGWRGDQRLHLFVVEVEGGGVRQLTEGDWDDLAPAWSPDGSRIAFISGRRQDRDQRTTSEVYVAPAGGGPPQCWSDGLSTVGAVAWSHDGQRLVAVGSGLEGIAVSQGWLYILDATKPPRRLIDDSLAVDPCFQAINRPTELRWTPDGRLTFLADRRGQSWLLEVSVDDGSSRAPWGSGCQSTALAVDKSARTAVALSSSPSSPGDLYRIDLDTYATKQLTHYNEEYLSQNPPARFEKFSIQRGGLEIECRLFLPLDFDPTRRYPLVMDVHGGPNRAFYDSFVPLQQVLATSGYLVLAANPRGSSTYGNDFVMAGVEDWGGEDYLDLMEAVDQVAKRPYVDISRMGVHGYSYGGFMSAWIVGHTDRFGAAVVGAPCIDLYSMYGTSDLGVSWGEAQWGGSIVDAAEALAERSPIRYAANVNTPVLLLHGEADARIPIAQSEEFFVALKRLGKEVELVRFPDSSHSFIRSGHPKMREEYLARTLGWFDRWLC